MIALIASYVVRAGKEEQAKQYIRNLQKNTRMEPGCRFYVGHQAAENPRKFCFYEQYDNQAALEAHRNAPHFAENITNGMFTIIEPGTRVAELFFPIE